MNLLAILLTAILFTLKLTGTIAVGWLIVFSPIIVLILWNVAVLFIAAVVAVAAATS